MDTKILGQAANEARGIAMDAVSAANSGHLGLPLGAAEIGAVLFGHVLQMNPDNPKWINRDRFVLSAGHGSMFLYTWLHLAGYDLPMEQIRNFRQLHSQTPGHPEFGETSGVECTTGPLGQGIGNAVGMAAAAKMAEARFNTDKYTLLNHHVFCLSGDGCLQEGVSSEASALAAHWGLDNLILIYDSNDVTLDASAEKTQSEDTAQRYEAYGFDVITINGHDMLEFLDVIETAKKNANGKPKLIIAKTLIGKGIPEVAGTSKAHGEAGVKFVTEARKALGLAEETFHISKEVYAFFAKRKETLLERYEAWEKTFKAWKNAHPDLAKMLEEGMHMTVPENLMACIPHFPKGKAMATRSAGGEALQPLAKALPLLLSGSADLHGSTKNLIKDSGDFLKENRMGRNLHWGIREHAMGATMNGIAYYGLFRVSGATFLTFSDYMRPSVRLAALARLPVFYIWTHDSVGVGEDGPTHQPVETTSSLRLIPNLDVIRPGDAEETAGAFVAALERTDGPTALVLTRQDIPSQDSIPVNERREGVLKGGYIAMKETGPLKIILLATGSELQHAMKAAAEIGDGARVVSMPCMERFERQSKTYRDLVLPPTCVKRIAIEAGVTNLWYKYVGTEGKVIGIDRFGMSAPGDAVMHVLGITCENLLEAALSL
jgi:transketolase